MRDLNQVCGSAGLIMNVGFVRPSITELSLAIFERSLHPELFVIRRQKLIRQAGYTATIRICDAGHLVSFRSVRGGQLTEALAHRAQPFPERQQLLNRKVKGSRDETLQAGGMTCHISYQVEKLAPESFLNQHEELLLDCERATLGHSFETSNRLSPAPLSFLQTDVWPHSLLIHSFHTFPSECAVVKTQTLFEL